MTGIEIAEILGVGRARFFTTLEGHNPTGSIKDRMVEAELELLEARHPDLASRGVAEVSAGSTAKSLAYFCGKRGIPFVAFIDQRQAELGRKLEAMGATVRALAASSMQEVFALYGRECSLRGWVPFQQFEDPTKRERYRSFGEAVRAKLPPIQHVVGAVGTGHSLMGTALAFPEAAIHSAEADGFAVNGTRNLDRVWFDEQDPLHADRPRLQRAIITEKQSFAGPIATDRGALEASASFRLVLGAAVEHVEGGCCFLVGADNRLELTSLPGA